MFVARDPINCLINPWTYFMNIFYMCTIIRNIFIETTELSIPDLSTRRTGLVQGDVIYRLDCF